MAYVLDKKRKSQLSLYRWMRAKITTKQKVTILPSAVSFFGNIAMSGGEAEAVEFGLNVGDYEAVLLVDKNSLPIDETSLIWQNPRATDGR